MRRQVCPCLLRTTTKNLGCDLRESSVKGALQLPSLSLWVTESSFNWLPEDKNILVVVQRNGKVIPSSRARAKGICYAAKAPRKPSRKEFNIYLLSCGSTQALNPIQPQPSAPSPRRPHPSGHKRRTIPGTHSCHSALLRWRYCTSS